MTISIVDSHVHLWTEAQLQTLAWHNPQNPLGSQHSVEEYLSSAGEVTSEATREGSVLSSQNYSLRGFVYLEVDRISSVDENGNKGWSHVLDEVSFLARIAHGSPLQSEGHVASHKQLLLGFVPWAPVPGGPAVLDRYISLAKERIALVASSSPSDPSLHTQTGADDVWKKLRGVRYLVQDKPAGTMLQPGFVEGLKWLGRQELTFDLGVDARQGGLSQLREAVELLSRVYGDGVEETDRVVVIINHMCKPNLHIDPTATDHLDTFNEWKTLIAAMATASNKTYMKLSGLFSEFPPLLEYLESTRVIGNENDVIDHIATRVRPWTDVIFDAFGSHRIMFGSDWPVCTVGNGGAIAPGTETRKRQQVAWSRWRAIVERILDTRGLSEDEKRDVWGGVAVRAYGINLT